MLACACVCLAAAASAASGAPTLKLKASFSPERLGADTTIRIGFRLSYPVGESPLPATGIRFFLPKGLGIVRSELGLQNCLPLQLQLHGRSACPPNSLMGHGSAVTAVPFGSRFVIEKTAVSLFSAPLREGNPQLLFVASGEYPVIAEVVFGAAIVPSGSRFGALIDAELPLVPSVPNGPDVALLSLSTTIGPAGIIYRERVGDRTISFKPRGILLPRSCPRGGFPFAVQLTFSDGSGIEAATAVRCPRRARA